VAGDERAVNGIASELRPLAMVSACAIREHTQLRGLGVVGALVVIAVVFFWPFGGKSVLGMVR